MPPSAVRTVRDLIYWQYAKLIGKSAGFSKNYRFIMSRFKKLQSGEIQWSGAIREYIRERQTENVCIYCESKNHLSIDHLIPQSRGGSDSGDNVVLACKSCNSSKGNRSLYEWIGLESRNDLPRIVEGKYLKLLYSLHDDKGTLDIDLDHISELCDRCDLGHLCPE
ncbi:MAG: HNH endonuclease, partial [Candidatus Hodarchaeota archaeon]